MAGFREWLAADGPRETGLRVRRRPSHGLKIDECTRGAPAATEECGHEHDSDVKYRVTIVIKFTIATSATLGTLMPYLHERPLNGKGNPGAAGFH